MQLLPWLPLALLLTGTAAASQQLQPPARERQERQVVVPSIRREDGRPFLSLPEGVLHLVPPELLAYTRSEAWTRGEPF